MDTEMNRNRHSRRLRAIIKIRRPQDTISDAQRGMLPPRQHYRQRPVVDRRDAANVLPARLRVDGSL